MTSSTYFPLTNMSSINGAASSEMTSQSTGALNTSGSSRNSSTLSCENELVTSDDVTDASDASARLSLENDAQTRVSALACSLDQYLSH